MSNLAKYNTYVGARYVPIFDGDWDITKDYEPLMIVCHNGNSYTSKTFIPKGIQITNTEYWALTGNYNAQVEYYRRETQAVHDTVELMRTAINAVVEGIDNTGNTVMGAKINELINAHSGSRIYFPSGTYLLEEPIVIPSNGVILVCDSGAEFKTNTSLNYLICCGSGTAPNNLNKMGIIGGVWNGANTLQCTIFVNNLEYQTVITDVFIKEFTECGLQIGTNNQTSTQCFVQNVNILAKANQRVTATGLLVHGTDNYINIVDIGHCKVGVNLGGSGNLLSNVHTWWGSTTIPYSHIDREWLKGCQAVRVSGNQRIVNLHMDNPYIGIMLTQNSNHLTVRNVVFNYDSEALDTLLENDWDACCVYYTEYTGTNRNSFDITGVCFTGKSGNLHPNIKSVRGNFPINIDNPNLWRFEYVGQPQLIQGFPLVDELNNVTRYPYNFPVTTLYQANVAQGWYLLGYIEDRNSYTKLRLTSKEGGGIEFAIQVKENTSITVTPGRLNRINDHLSIMVGNTRETIGSKKYYPIYIKKWASGTFYSALTLNILNCDHANIYMRRNFTFGEPLAEAPTGTEIDLYTLSAFKHTDLDTNGDTLAPNNSKDYDVTLTYSVLEHLASVTGVHCGNSNLVLSIFSSDEHTVKVRVHNASDTTQTVGTVTVQYLTELT